MSTSLLQVQFQGVEEGVDPKALPPGTLLCAENYMMDKGRRLVKRLGTSYLTRAILGGDSIIEGQRLQTRGKDVVMTSGAHTLTYSPELGHWQKTGRPPTLRVTKRGLVDSTRSAISTDIAISGNLLITATLTGYSVPRVPFVEKASSLFVAIENIETGAKVLSPLLLNEVAAWARVHVSNNFAVVTYSAINGAIWIAKINLTTLALTTTFVENAAPECTPCDSSIAIDPVEGGYYVYLAWAMSSGDRLKLAKIRLSDFGNVSFSTLLAGSIITPKSVSICATSTGVHVMVGSPNPSLCRIWTLNPTTFSITVGPVDLTPASVKYVSVQE